MPGKRQTERRTLNTKVMAAFQAYLAELGLDLPQWASITPSVWWHGRTVMILDQRRLPHKEGMLVCRNTEAVAQAIRTLAVRGAPAIGLAAAFGAVLALKKDSGDTKSGSSGGKAAAGRGKEGAGDRSALASRFGAALRMLLDTRPTAVNLAGSIRRQAERFRRESAGRRPALADMTEALLDEARALHREIIAQDMEMGLHGASLIEDGECILTHCHTGGAATGGLGTALGVIKTAHAAGKKISVLCCETRPLLQGARLTAWELQREGVPFHLISDSAAAHYIGRGEVQRVLVGADRIAVNGDTANKIGTRAHALLAWQADVPFHVAAPTTTVDPDLPTGEGIPIEERAEVEIQEIAGSAICLPDTPIRNPAFDVTPGAAVTSFITEQGISEPPLDRIFIPRGMAAGCTLAVDPDTPADSDGGRSG